MFYINERLPYERKAENLPRILLVYWSNNMVDFLTDETGSVRWIIFECHWEELTLIILKIDMDNV